jgi:hypothetical protein
VEKVETAGIACVEIERNKSCAAGLAEGSSGDLVVRNIKLGADTVTNNDAYIGDTVAREETSSTLSSYTTTSIKRILAAPLSDPA